VDLSFLCLVVALYYLRVTGRFRRKKIGAYSTTGLLCSLQCTIGPISYNAVWSIILISKHCSVLFFSRPRSEGWPHHGRSLLSPFIPVLCHSDWLFHGEYIVHILMLSIQAVRGLPRLRAPGIVPCIISFSRPLPCFLMVWTYYASFLALTVSNSSLFTTALLRTHLFSLLSMKPATSF